MHFTLLTSKNKFNVLVICLLTYAVFVPIKNEILRKRTTERLVTNYWPIHSRCCCPLNAWYTTSSLKQLQVSCDINAINCQQTVENY